jgi:manganese/iron transport system ATP-binding protein
MPLTNWMHKPEPHQLSAPVVEFNHVAVRYEGAAPALEDVSFQLMRGERVAIVGPNGAGKSTLFKLIAGIMPPTTGDVKVYGYGARGHICVGYVPQRTQVDWSFPVTVADVVMMGRVAKLGLFRQAGRHDWQLVHDSLERVGISALANRQIGELSGGQQQRVFIARTITQEAELLLMDEPLNGLDVPSQEAIFEIMDQLRATGMTVLVSTHDLHLAAGRFDRLMLLKRRLLGLGTAAQVLTPANLRLAYGAQMTVVPNAGGDLVFGDTCCEGEDEEEEHSHA